MSVSWGSTTTAPALPKGNNEAKKAALGNVQAQAAVANLTHQMKKLEIKGGRSRRNRTKHSRNRNRSRSRSHRRRR